MENLAKVLNSEYDKMIKDDKNILYRQNKNSIKFWTSIPLAFAWYWGYTSIYFKSTLTTSFFILTLIWLIFRILTTFFKAFKIKDEIKHTFKLKNEIKIYKTNLCRLDDLEYFNKFYIDYDSNILTVKYLTGTVVYKGEMKELIIQKEEKFVNSTTEKSFVTGDYKTTHNTVKDIKYIFELENDKFITIENPEDEIIELFRDIDNSRT